MRYGANRKRNLSGRIMIKSGLVEGQTEEAVEIPLDRIIPDTLRKLIEEFVMREWSELTDSGYTLDEKSNRSCSS